MNIPTIRHEPMSDIFHKYHIENFGVDAVLHEFLKAEPEDADAHDHPFDFTIFVLKGSYTEIIWEEVWERQVYGVYYPRTIKRSAGESFSVDAETIHKIVNVSTGGCKTLMLPGPATRKSGFWKFDACTDPYEKGYYTGKFREWDQPDFK